MRDAVHVTALEPAEYAETLAALQRSVHDARFTLQRRANAELIALHWRIGRTILERQAESGWGSEDASRLADDLRAAFPSLPEWSASQLLSMRAFAEVWPERHGIVQQPVGQLPWGHIVVLLTEVDDQPLREWYAGKAIEHTWGRDALREHIASRRHEADAATPGNFAGALANADSDLARDILHDPSTRAFLAVDSAGPREDTAGV